ncbi:hypothetical protein AXG93_4855s1060 [Marchantia polymorpha subsp. ruderalis]|uniref:Uncharacterized protein n=1 Tax=Marchantia polymorpha subsp. ruderalis TaxID=1480154 RepID=A0A176VQ36_MARPO|nr:hypothetical protein AXG93_4855s1060 [Marchantia polymorpha subsp. ruderalis]
MASPETSMGTVILETGKNPLAEEIKLEGINVADVLSGQVIPLLRTRVKVATTQAVAEKERQLRKIEAKYEILRKRLAEEVELRKSSEKTCESLRADIEVTRCAEVDLWDRLEASQVAFNEKSQRIDELTADLEKKNQTHAAEVAVKLKALAV